MAHLCRDCRYACQPLFTLYCGAPHQKGMMRAVTTERGPYGSCGPGGAAFQPLPWWRRLLRVVTGRGRRP